MPQRAWLLNQDVQQVLRVCPTDLNLEIAADVGWLCVPAEQRTERRAHLVNFAFC